MIIEIELGYGEFAVGFACGNHRAAIAFEPLEAARPIGDPLGVAPVKRGVIVSFENLESLAVLEAACASVRAVLEGKTTAEQLRAEYESKHPGSTTERLEEAQK